MTEFTITESDYNPDEHYPPVGTEEAALCLFIDADTFTVLAHTGRFLHGSINCAGFDGVEIGFAPSERPDEPGYWVFRGGRVVDVSDWEHPRTEFDLSGDWAPAQPEDFAHFGVELPAHYFPGITDVVRFYSAAIKNGRTIRDVYHYLFDEVIELKEEIRLDHEGLPPGEDGIVGESIDVIACALDAIFLARPDITNQELAAMMQRKCEKWAKNYS